jgi:carbamoyl-phosphate synthase large subunit
MIEGKQLAWIVNTPSSGGKPRRDEVRMRAHAVIRGIPITTTMDGLRAAINGLATLRQMESIEVCSLQEYHRHAPRLMLHKAKAGGGADRGSKADGRGAAEG